jgi:hypothetical protein
MATMLAVAILLFTGTLGTGKYFTWSKSNVKDVASYVQSVADGDVRFVIRPHNFASLLNYYYKGATAQVDEVYLDQPLGGLVDTAASFVYVSLEAQTDIREYMDHHFAKVAERQFPGDAHLGMIVGVYRQRPEADTTTPH